MLEKILYIADLDMAFILGCKCLDFTLGAVLRPIFKKHILKDSQVHPVVCLYQSLIQAKRNYHIFDKKKLFVIIFYFKENRPYLEGNKNRLEVIVSTNHHNLESLMTT